MFRFGRFVRNLLHTRQHQHHDTPLFSPSLSRHIASPFYPLLFSLFADMVLRSQLERGFLFYGGDISYVQSRTEVSAKAPMIMITYVEGFGIHLHRFQDGGAGFVRFCHTPSSAFILIFMYGWLSSAIQARRADKQASRDSIAHTA